MINRMNVNPRECRVNCSVCFLFIIFTMISLSVAEARQQKLVWERVLGDTSHSPQGVMLYHPQAVRTDDGGTIHVLQKESIEKFDQRGRHLGTITLKKGKGPGEFAQPVSFTIDREGNYYVLDEYLRRISRFDSRGRFVRSFIIEFWGYGIELWRNTELVVLGQGDGAILHVMSLDGEHKKSFGAPLSSVGNLPQAAMNPRFWCVRSDTIYVAHPMRYEARMYISEQHVKTFTGSKQFQPPKTRPTRGGGLGVAPLEYISGLGVLNGKLLVSIFRMTSSPSTLEIFDLGTGKHVQGSEVSYWLKWIDQNQNLYFTEEDRVMIGRLK